MQEWSIQDLARAAGVTSRTLRHYGDRGLLEPSRIGSNGYRYYDADSLLRLQRILLLRDLGLGLTAIAGVLAGRQDAASALETHLDLLERERERLGRQIDAVRTTLYRTEKGEPLMAEEMFDGFEHTQYKDEVEQRWGTKAYADGNRWWTSMDDAQRRDWKADVARLSQDWIAAAESGVAPDSAHAQDLARRHVQWLSSVPGTPAWSGHSTGSTPGHSRAPVREYVLGLADMYVDDERFAANYGGRAGAEFVRDALRTYMK
ncbi:MerR family transcriptional regulator [Rhodococcus sp. RD6.2]|uniref:MerR family transcriptional regulator n=1 Tax=Rhodococcus sp. RD6.2 TaxID=260936 RepID=UPI00063BCFF6|nr:TipAS antibiotic-recognition domain-containing protein [Rhodococcus sp. RD6.2]CRK54350.1 MerR family transcriptional regulator [Rhodococcus sp. RD6.2]